MKTMLCILLALSAANVRLATAADAALPARVPTILCTDIGDDIDDTWALALALRCP